MPESLRTAGRNLLRYLSALFVLARSAGEALRARLRPALAGLRSGAASRIERLPGAIESVRAGTAKLLQRLADAVAPPAATPEPATADADPEFADLLADLGAQPPSLEGGFDTTLKDTTIRALSDNLHGLRDLGDQLARAEQDKLALTARVAELEAGAGPHREDAVFARLERELELREALLARTREQLGGQRAKTDDWKRKAAERWREIRSLRHRVKRLERTLADAGVGPQPGPLPKRAASGPRAS